MMLTARIKKYDNIDTVLDILSRTGDIRFSRKGNTITIEIGRASCRERV